MYDVETSLILQRESINDVVNSEAVGHHGKLMMFIEGLSAIEPEIRRKGSKLEQIDQLKKTG